MTEGLTEIERVTNHEKLIAVLGSLVTAEETSLTARGVFDGMPAVVAKAIAHDTSGWYMASFDRKHWRAIYLERYTELGYIQPDLEDYRRYQITDSGQQVFENWLTA